MTPRAVILGLEGPSLSSDERAFLREADPWGLILFRRNVSDPGQVRALTDELRDLFGRDAPILIDQEGGRVQRLGPPHWPAYPPAARLGELHAHDPAAALDASRDLARLIGEDLAALGIDVDCLPVLDVPSEGAHDVIGDRAYAREPAPVAALALAACEGLLAAGVLPVIKHIPGHGRAGADSHLSLPVVEASRADLEGWDFPPFRALAGMPMAMTAHVTYTALDPARPATTSPTVIAEVIRGWIGFGGLLMSDDLSMKALDGSFEERARASLDAGCDVVLHCNGRRDEAAPIVAASPRLSGQALIRAEAALARRARGPAFDVAQARARVAALA